ncbi:Dehydration-responsive element-binding protein 1F [Vitis vinifera]|uniref:Dehydration-responsive element-binding protein 1F n=1 Tax=Vitis vinifera TaxID=29760 RepID=A0A438JLC7_VITVI|nr:Dehydration-responsive element-binding protein 1F [Vitis vinifera]
MADTGPIPEWITNTSFSHCKFKWTSSINFVIRIHSVDPICQHAREFFSVGLANLEDHPIRRGSLRASDRPKKRADRRKFKETRHPVYRGVRRRNGNMWVCELQSPIRSREYGWDVSNCRDGCTGA